VLDHIFTEAIAALRDGLEGAMLEPQLAEERLLVDVLAGDLTWQTSYSLPGEGEPPRVRADLTLEWSTWSQAAYRSWRLGEPLVEPTRVGLELVVRLQRLAAAADPDQIISSLVPMPWWGTALDLERTGPRLETTLDSDLGEPEHAIEIGWEGGFGLDEALLSDPSRLDGRFADIGGWIAATLVRLADLRLVFLPPDAEDSDGD